MIHHRVDGVLELEDFAFHVNGNLFGKVAGGHGGGHISDVADLAGQIAGHEVDAVGQVFPGAGHATHVGLAAQLAFRAHLAGHARHFGGERPELIHHRVDGVLELEDFAFDVHRDLLGQVAGGDGGGDVSDVADLTGQVAGHEVDAVGQVFPGAGHAAHVGLAAQLAFRADLAGHTRHFRGEGAELVHHGIDHVLDLQNFTPDIDRDLLREVAGGNRGRHLGYVAQLDRQIAGH